MKAGLLGERLSHSMSPRIHALICEKAGFMCEYGLYEKAREEAGAFLRGLKSQGFDGLNVTIPYKIAALSVFEPDGAARRIGAANTIDVKSGKAYNTDYDGFLYMLKKAGVETEGKRAVIMGLGGAARACAYALLDAGASVTVASRDPSKRLDGFEVTGYDGLAGDILVNATPVGMYPNIRHTPARADTIERFSACVDLIYNPAETLFLSLARVMGKKTAGGLNMLIMQAVRAHEIWRKESLPGVAESVWAALCAQ